MKKEKSNKIKAKTYTSVYFKYEDDKTIQKIDLKLIEYELESSISNDEINKKHNNTFCRLSRDDENIGYIHIPEEWEIITIDGWMYIVDTAADSENTDYIAVEYYYGTYSNGGNANDTWDTRVFNDYFSEYSEVIHDGILLYSTGSYLLTYEFDHLETEVEFYGLELNSHIDSYYQVMFVFVDKSIDESILTKITYSYEPFLD